MSRTHTVLLREMSSTAADSAGLESPPHLVQAMFDFTAHEADELEFKRNDVITVTNAEDANWWQGTLNGTTGVFPSSYVMAYNEQPAA